MLADLNVLLSNFPKTGIQFRSSSRKRDEGQSGYVATIGTGVLMRTGKSVSSTSKFLQLLIDTKGF